MKLKLISFLMIAVLVVSVATASMLIPANDRAKERAKAPEKSPAIGENWDLERVDFVHYAKGGNKPDKPGRPPKQATCYKLMGIKWKELAVDYVINPANPDGLTESFVVDTITTSAETWDSATSVELLNSPSVDYSAQYGVQNYENAIVFDNYAEPGVIGVTSIWYTRKGKKIVEFDMILDTDYAWGDATAGNSTIMDLENIATHELGHAVGLDDIYSDACSTVTMYGYSDYMETSKRTLEQPDITGLQQMYGP